MIPGPYPRSSLAVALLQAAHHIATHNKSHLLRWLMGFGALGVFGVAIVDSSIIPLPLPGSTDLLLLLLTAHRGTSQATAIWLVACAFTGSLIGGYLCWSAGRKGGEVALERYVPPRLLRRVTRWVQRRGAWSVALAALLPPPIPLTPVILAAGALKVQRIPFLLSFGIARLIRYSVVVWLALRYGPHIVRVWQHTLAGWTAPILWTYGALVVAGIAFGIWKYRRNSAGRARQPAQEPA